MGWESKLLLVVAVLEAGGIIWLMFSSASDRKKRYAAETEAEAAVRDLAAVTEKRRLSGMTSEQVREELRKQGFLKPPTWSADPDDSSGS